MNFEDHMKMVNASKFAPVGKRLTHEQAHDLDYKRRSMECLASDFLTNKQSLYDLMQLIQVLRYEKNAENNEMFLDVISRLYSSFKEQDLLSLFHEDYPSFRAKALYILSRSVYGDPLYVDYFRTLCQRYESFLVQSLPSEDINGRTSTLGNLADLYCVAKTFPEFTSLSETTRQQKVDMVGNKLLTEALTLSMSLRDRIYTLHQFEHFDVQCGCSESVVSGFNKSTLQTLIEFLIWVNTKTANSFVPPQEHKHVTSGDLQKFQEAMTSLPETGKKLLQLELLNQMWSAKNTGFLILLDFIITGDERLLVEYIRTLMTQDTPDKMATNAMHLSIFLFDSGDLDSPCWSTASRSARQEIEKLLRTKYFISAGVNQVQQVVRYWLQSFKEEEPKAPVDVQPTDLSTRVALLEEIVRNQNRILQSLRRKRRR
jgi:hypothetical protein